MKNIQSIMGNDPSGSRGISEIASVVLILILVVALGAVVFAVLSGSFDYVQKTSLVAATADVAYVPIDATTSFPVFDVMPRAGEQFYLTGQQGIPAGAPSASFVLVTPDNTVATTNLADYGSPSGIYGKSLYVYRDMRGGGYWVTDSMQTNNKDKYLLPLANGTWTVRMVDNTVNVVLTEMTVPITGIGSLTNPQAPKTIWTNTSELSLSNSSGYQIPFTNYGVVPFTGPNGLRMFRYNGTGAYIQGSDNPDLDYTGDLSLSFWLQPTAAGVNGYHQLVGKGQPGDTDENYDMFIVNQRLYFEWTDRNTGNIYHIMTTSTMPWGSPPDLNYVTMTISSGTPTIYFGGVAQPVGYYQSNVPGVNPVAPVPVNLRDNNNPITIGKQNFPGNEMYYAGNMSEISFYNRALTAADISGNIVSYQT